jgi:hypothetical protein
MVEDQMNYILETQSCESRPAEALYFRFKHCGWAVLFLDEASGCVSINSDYGDFAYRWSQSGRGEGVSLKQFFCEVSAEYLAEKFMGPGARAFDLDATKAEFKKEIIKKRRGTGFFPYLEKNEARDLFDEIDRADSQTADLFMAYLSKEAWAAFDNEPFHLLEESYTPTYRWVLEGLIPAMQAELRKALPTEAAK